MGFHQKHAHGRVFEGLEARDNKLHFIHNAVGGEKDSNVQTVYSQVYVTLPNTYTGSVVWVTQTGTELPSTTTIGAAEASYLSAKSAINKPSPKGTNVAKGSPIHTAHSSTLKGSPPQQTRAATTAKGTPISQSNSGLIAEKSHGMSGGAKAGLAFGILILIALAGGLVYFCWRRRKQQLDNEGREPLDEKHVSKNSFFGGTAAAPGNRSSIQTEKSFTTSRTAAASTAPRLSLRPGAQFLPNLFENRKSSSGALDVPSMSEKPKSAWERQPKNAQNPFTDAAVVNEKQAEAATNPFEDSVGIVVPQGPSTPTHSAKNSLEGSEIGTPKVGTASAVSMTAGAATDATARGPNNVHRVQLDFKPSMDDELELRSGQLVRMLHEYDDGWALCIRMDRSQQGVCPRTCLSKLPVKPRPQGSPPNGPKGRPMGPPPPHMRGPPPPGKNAMMPRPLTPTGRERSNTGPRSGPSPQAVARPRSQSVSAASDRPVSPIDAGVPARKPVPGQAM